MTRPLAAHSSNSSSPSSTAPTRRVRYLPELDMEIEIVEPPRKAIVNKDLRVRALREHWDGKEPHQIHRHTPSPKPFRCVSFIRGDSLY